jgi:16S rRNA (uracil1498-N3)-methyltransferase
MNDQRLLAMHYFYLPQLTPKHEFAMLPEEEGRHALKALRMRVGDELQLLDGQGGHYQATLYGIDGKRCEVRIDRYTLQPRAFSRRIHLAVAPTKNTDRMEWLLEKAVELGVDQITFLHSRYSERKTMNLERLHKIAVAAMKQSGNFYLTKLADVTPFRDFLAKVEEASRYMAYVPAPVTDTLAKAAARAEGDACVLIGPEGGFAEEEAAAAIEAGFACVSLSHNRLRTETAALSAAHTLQVVMSMQLP